jgi:multidrug efflux pump subunit AcrB
MSISEPFIRRPIVTSLMLLVFILFCICAYYVLPVAAVAFVVFRTICVS